jgi:hypothetical protein
MLKHTKFRPYIRRLKGHEEAKDLLTSIQLSFYKKLINEGELKKAYILTQRGFSNHVLAISSSKQELIEKALHKSVHTDFGTWAKELQTSFDDQYDGSNTIEFIQLAA